MSTRIMFFSEPNTASATALESSVLPTPVGPRNKNDPIGRLGSRRPARPRFTAAATAFTASSCPITRSWSLSSSFARRLDSDSVSRAAGIPVQSATTAATVCSPTSFFLFPAPSFFFSFSSSASRASCSFWDSLAPARSPASRQSSFFALSSRIFISRRDAPAFFP